MTNEDMLTRIEEMLDQKVEPIYQRLDVMEKRLEGMSNVLVALDTRTRRMEVEMENVIMPGIREIQKCYLDTYKRYQVGVDQNEEFMVTVKSLELTVEDHSKRLLAAGL